MGCYYLVAGILFNLCADAAPPPVNYFQPQYSSTLEYQSQLLGQLLIQRELNSPDRLPRCVPGIC